MEKQNYRPCVGGILILVAATLGTLTFLLNYIITCLRMGDAVPSGYITVMLTNLVRRLLTSLPVILMAVMLIRKKRGVIITVLSGIMMAMSEISFVTTLIYISQIGVATLQNVNWFGDVILIACYTTLLVLSITTRSPQPNGFTKLWFLPGAFYGLYAVSVVFFSISNTLSSAGMMYMDVGTKIATIIGTVIGAAANPALYTAGYFLTGKWLANPYKKGYQPQPRYDEQTMQALNYYKWQYESGAITWEQYNAAIQPYLAQNNK